MKIERMAWIGWLTLMAAAGARAQDPVILVGVENVDAAPAPVLAQAQVTASKIYAGAGVKLKWCRKAQIWMQFDTDEAEGDHPGALAYTLPYKKGRTLIRVLLNRLIAAGSDRQVGALLGHVMAHELGHVLEGSNWHADSGVMKAHWAACDIKEMEFRPLSFSTNDVVLIHAGIARFIPRVLAVAEF